MAALPISIQTIEQPKLAFWISNNIESDWAPEKVIAYSAADAAAVWRETFRHPDHDYEYPGPDQAKYWRRAFNDDDEVLIVEDEKWKWVDGRNLPHDAQVSWVYMPDWGKVGRKTSMFADQWCQFLGRRYV